MKSFDVKHQGVAGTLESSDVQILIDKNPGNGIDLELTSSVEKQFGRQIKKVIMETLENLGVTDAKLVVTDQGALDCTIKARLISAVHRASDQEKAINWEELEEWNV